MADSLLCCAVNMNERWLNVIRVVLSSDMGYG